MDYFTMLLKIQAWDLPNTKQEAQPLYYSVRWNVFLYSVFKYRTVSHKYSSWICEYISLIFANWCLWLHIKLWFIWYWIILEICLF